MRCISGERGRRTMVHILPTPRSQQITILTTLSGRPSHFSHKTFHKKLFKFHPPHFSHKNISKLTRPISYKKKTFHIFTANSWSIQKHFDNWKNCYCQHEQIVTTMSEMMCFNKLNETLFQKEWISGTGERWESFFMTRKSVAFGLPWFTSGLKKVVFDDRIIMLRRIHLRGSHGLSVQRAQKTKARGPKGLQPGDF